MKYKNKLRASLYFCFFFVRSAKLDSIDAVNNKTKRNIEKKKQNLEFQFKIHLQFIYIFFGFRLFLSNLMLSWL